MKAYTLTVQDASSILQSPVKVVVGRGGAAAGGERGVVVVVVSAYARDAARRSPELQTIPNITLEEVQENSEHNHKIN